MRHIQFDPRRAYEAARTLASDPDDLPQVFSLIESLSGDTLHRTHAHMQRTETGRVLLEKRPDIVDLLADRESLSALPEGSLGRAYLAFVDRENISASGIRDAAARGSNNGLPAPLDYVNARLRDTHDLWHAVVGYHGDVLGETALLAFTFMQTWNPAIGVIIAIAFVKLGAGEARAVILDGFRRGKKAAWLPGQDWEALLPLPLEEVRARLGVEAPREYAPLRTAALRAQGLWA